MAEFIDVGNGLVKAPDGRVVFANSIDPARDRIVAPAAPPPTVSAPATAAPITGVGPVGAPLSAAPPAQPAQTPGVASVLQKLEHPSIAAIRQPGMVVQQQSTTTQSGIPSAVLDPMIAGNTARGEAMAGTVEQAGEDRAQRREQNAMADSTAAYGRQQVAAADQAEAEQRAQIARQNELAMSLQKDPEIDPDRFVKNMSTGTSIGTVVLAALNGAFKGMVGQSGNDVMDILSKRISEDIASQREQIQSGRVRRGNLIAYFQNAGLREEAAAKAAEATSWAMVDRMVAAERERIGAGEDRTAADLLAEQLKLQTAAKNDELKLAAVPRSSTTTVRGPADTGGGGGSESFQKFLAARKAYEEAGATPEQLKAFDATSGIPEGFRPGGPSDTQLKRGELNEAQGKSQAAADAIEQLGQKAGLKRDPKTGKWTGGADVFRQGSFWDTDGEFSSAFQAAVEAYGRMQSGGVIGADEREAFEDMLSARRGNVLANKLNAAEVTIQARQKADRVGGQPAPSSWK
jgi:hypothetical protein